MAELLKDVVSMQNSLNSVSQSTLTGVDSDGYNTYSRDFTGNDIAFAHTTEEVNRKAHTTQAEASDQEVYFPGREALKEAIEAAKAALATVTDTDKAATLKAAIKTAQGVYETLQTSADTVTAAVTTLNAAVTTATAAAE